MWPLTSYYVRILYAELNAEFCLCIFKELSYAASACMCADARLWVRCNISADISPGTEGRLNGPACEVPRSYLCSRHTSSLLMHSPQIESGIDRKSCLLLYARVTTWFSAFYVLEEEDEVRRVTVRKVEVEFSNLTILNEKRHFPLESNAPF